MGRQGRDEFPTAEIGKTHPARICIKRLSVCKTEGEGQISRRIAGDGSGRRNRRSGRQTSRAEIHEQRDEQFQGRSARDARALHDVNPLAI